VFRRTTSGAPSTAPSTSQLKSCTAREAEGVSHAFAIRFTLSKRVPACSLKDACQSSYCSDATSSIRGTLSYSPNRFLLHRSFVLFKPPSASSNVLCPATVPPWKSFCALASSPGVLLNVCSSGSAGKNFGKCAGAGSPSSRKAGALYATATQVCLQRACMSFGPLAREKKTGFGAHLGEPSDLKAKGQRMRERDFERLCVLDDS